MAPEIATERDRGGLWEGIYLVELRTHFGGGYGQTNEWLDEWINTMGTLVNEWIT